LRMITNLLDIAKADEGRLAPARQPIDAEVLVKTVVEELAGRAASSGIVLGTDIATRQVLVDPDLMHRVLANLVENAIRHAPEGSEVRIQVAPTTDGFELRVADAGPGVPAELRDKIFERFETANASRSNRGLGLAFCKLAVEAHGGKIWIEDRSPGAVFVMRMLNGT